mgnify:CR=1 FL=1
MKKFLSMTVLLLIIVLAGCQKDQTTKPKQKTNTNDAKVVKIEKLETMSYEDFYENLKEEELNDLDIIQVADQKITAVTGNYFLVLNENKKNHTYKINKIIDLHPYGMNYYYKEESTMFYPSKDGEKYLIYNECRYNSKDQTINAKDDKELKSIVIDLKKDEVTYRKGNHLENLKKKEGVSENNYPKIAKFSKDMKQYAKKKKYELMTNFYLKSGKDRFWVMKPFFEDCLYHHEEAWIMLQNKALKVLGVAKVGEGGLDETVFDQRIILQYMLKSNAHSVMLFHNHPSQNLNFSQQDLQLTRNIIQACKILRLECLDHIIVGENGYKSYTEQEYF